MCAHGTSVPFGQLERVKAFHPERTTSSVRRIFATRTLGSNSRVPKTLADTAGKSFGKTLTPERFDDEVDESARLVRY
jgi:hypothetical protein